MMDECFPVDTGYVVESPQWCRFGGVRNCSSAAQRDPCPANAVSAN